MAVKLELYRIFRTVAEEESISAAAKTLFISQSAVSQSIHQLEEQLQVRLFSRQPRGVTLTGEGRVLYDYVRSAINLIETGEEKVQQTRELMMGELVIGASDTVTRSLLLPYLQRFHERYPAIRLKVLNGTSYEALQMLRAGQVDLAFASTPQERQPADAALHGPAQCFCGGAGLPLRDRPGLYPGGAFPLPADAVGAQIQRKTVPGTLFYPQWHYA